MKKKILTVVLFLILLCGVVGTTAYYTTQGTARNVITSGNIRVDLQEWGDLAMTEPFENPEGIVPDDVVTKVVTARNIGSNPAWIRIRVDKSFKLVEESEAAKEAAEKEESLIVLDINTTDWTEKDGWYYYNTPLEPNAVSKPLFTTVSFDEEMSNVWQGGQVIIDITMNAVQVANNGTAVMEAAGWSAE